MKTKKGYKDEVLIYNVKESSVTSQLMAILRSRRVVFILCHSRVVVVRFVVCV